MNRSKSKKAELRTELNTRKALKLLRKIICLGSTSAKQLLEHLEQDEMVCKF